MRVLIEVSARHVHLSEPDFFKLFGKNAKLNVKKKLSQKGQFLSDFKLEIKGPKSSIKNVSILGPFRSKTQIEISLSDSFKLGLRVPIRESGILDDTPGCLLIGKIREVKIPEGLIIAKRHIHLSKEIADEKNFKNGQEVSIKINSKDRSLIFYNTIIRVSENFSDRAHIDTDEANAAGVEGDVFCTIL